MRIRKELISIVLTVCVSWALVDGTQRNTLAQESRPRLSRRDLAELRKRDRPGVFAALGSFDDCGLSEHEFTVRALDLIDARRVPGLAAADNVDGCVIGLGVSVGLGAGIRIGVVAAVARNRDLFADIEPGIGTNGLGIGSLEFLD